MKLETSRLGQSDLEITRVGIGTAPFGSTPNWRIYWGPQDESEAIRTIEVALDLGVNWIDTAPFYGWGQAEQIVGKALLGKRYKMSKVVRGKISQQPASVAKSKSACAI